MSTALYYHRTKRGKLLYVGITNSLPSRLRDHKALSPWFHEVARIDLEWFPTRYEAQVAEVDAIRTLKPPMNTPGAPRWVPYNKRAYLQADDGSSEEN